MSKHPTDRKQRLQIKRKKYEESQEALQGKASALRQLASKQKRKQWLKLQEASEELAAYKNGI